MSTAWAGVIGALTTCMLALAIAFLVMGRRIAAVLGIVESWLAAPELRPPGLQPGDRIHPFTAMRHDGTPFRDVDLHGTPHLILFMKSDCTACRGLSRQLSRSALDALGAGEMSYVVLRDEHERDLLELDPRLQTVYQADGVMSWAFRSNATPQAFVIDGRGLVTATGFPNAIEHVTALLERGDPQIQLP